MFLAQKKHIFGAYKTNTVMPFPEKIGDISWVKLAFTLLFSIIIFWPMIKDLWNPEMKTVDKDLKGKNGRWDDFELRARDSLRIGRGCFVSLIMMLFASTLFDKEYPFYLWMMFFSGTVGFAGISAFVLKTGIQYAEKSKE